MDQKIIKPKMSSCHAFHDECVEHEEEVVLLV